jgi:hypothetical protein
VRLVVSKHQGIVRGLDEAVLDSESIQAMNITDIKHCCKCKCHKPRSDFAESTVARDGKQPWCRQCMKAYRAAKKAAKEVA